MLLDCNALDITENIHSELASWMTADTLQLAYSPTVQFSLIL